MGQTLLQVVWILLDSGSAAEANPQAENTETKRTENNLVGSGVINYSFSQNTLLVCMAADYDKVYESA